MLGPGIRILKIQLRRYTTAQKLLGDITYEVGQKNSTKIEGRVHIYRDDFEIEEKSWLFLKEPALVSSNRKLSMFRHQLLINVLLRFKDYCEI